ncbi:MAG TPA: GYD domain-containing protein [Burkholderiales bacterium]|nr:GYD domain-containing protein [Burkholderiales bacterium]
MAKYLIKASYTLEGTKGLLKEGGSNRKAAVAQMIQGLGGKLEAFYYAFSEPDVFAIMDVPDASAAAAISLVVNSRGAARVSTTPLITPEEIDAACKKSVAYRAPGA